MSRTGLRHLHVPGYMVGAAPPPAYNNIQALNQQYYSQCLQSLIESLESCLDHGLGLTEIAGRDLGVEFDLDDLLRMDTATLTAALKEQVAAGITSPNEARERLNLPPVPGGDTPYLQQQNYSLAALDKRDTGDDPFGKALPRNLRPRQTLRSQENGGGSRSGTDCEIPAPDSQGIQRG